MPRNLTEIVVRLLGKKWKDICFWNKRKSSRNCLQFFLLFIWETNFFTYFIIVVFSRKLTKCSSNTKHIKTNREDQTLDRWFDAYTSNVTVSRQNGKSMSLTADWILHSARPRKYFFFHPKLPVVWTKPFLKVGKWLSFWSINLKSEENC